MSKAIFVRLVGGLLAFALCACGAKPAEPQPAATSGAEQSPAQRPVPTDPLAVVPGNVTELAVVDLKALRASSHLTQARAILARGTCIVVDPGAGVLARTDRLVVGRVDGAAMGRAETVAIGIGRYTPEDARAVLAELAQAAGTTPAALTEQPHERFHIVSDGQRSAAVLAPHMLVATDAAQMAGVLERIDGGGSDVTRGAIFTAVDAQAWIADQDVALIAAGSPARSEQLARNVAVAGNALRRAVAEGVLGAAVTLRDGLSLHLRWKLTQPAHAHELVAEGRRLLWQVDLLLRLAGLPALGSRVQSDAQGPLADFTLQLSADELQRLAARLDDAMRARAPRCDAVAAGAT